ncbi:MAG: transporter substrate-binding domain-containing protein [Cytophagales bacterium]|jgi:hypothetical protein|nr:transporter substrate-binding domain-containing protein [Cytophagales bacterium]
MRYLFFALLFSLTISVKGQGSFTWCDAQQLKKGTITVYWFPNKPFEYQDASGNLKGIEVDIIYAFQQYLEKRYGIRVKVNWVRQSTFEQVLDHMKYDSLSGVFGAAGFSFTEERKAFMKFSSPFMADMAVLVSTTDIPIVKSRQDLAKYFCGATALAAKGSILESELLVLRAENDLDFKIEYTGGSDLVIDLLQKRKKSFGFLDLPVYLMRMNGGITNLQRHTFMTKRYHGRVVGLPITSDWDEPLHEFFTSEDFQSQIETLIGRYINIDLYHFVEALSPGNEIGLLDREKSIQNVQLSYQDLALKKKSEQLILLGTAVVIVMALLVTIGYLYREQKKSRMLLFEQKSEIETHAAYIKSINENLELIVHTRTRELKEKNRALEEYSFIAAHKLRAPLARILGLVNLIDRITMAEEDKVLITYLKVSSKELDVIVREVMKIVDEPEKPLHNE